MASRLPSLAMIVLAIETEHELAARYPMAGGHFPVAGRKSQMPLMAFDAESPPP
jgi:hypothetical protein